MPRRRIVDPTTQTQTLYIPFASPPTPCPSPSPVESPKPFSGTISNVIDPHAAPSAARRHYLSTLLRGCTPAELLYISNTIAPLLKRDFLGALPTELGVHILAFIDDPCTLAHAGMVSRAWRSLAADEWLWRRMCNVWGFMGELGIEGIEERWVTEEEPLEEMEQYAALTMDPALEWLTARKRKARRVRLASVVSPSHSPSLSPRQPLYKSFFKYSYITMMNWRHGGHLLRSHRLPGLSCTTTPEPTNLHPTLHSHQTSNPTLPSHTYLHPLLSLNAHQAHPQAHTHTPTPTPTPVPADTGVVTSLALDADWVVVGLAGSRIHVFSARTGVLARTLVGHEAGVWGVCLVSRSGGRKDGRREGKEQLEMQDAFAATNLRGDRSPSQPIQPSSRSRSSSSSGKPRSSRSGACSSTSSSKPMVSVDGFTKVMGKKAKKARSGKGVASDWRDEGHDHLVSPSLRVALGLGANSDSDMSVEDMEVEVDKRQNWEWAENQLGVGGRGVVVEDAEDEAAPRPAQPAYVPGRQSDPCFASEGWGQPNALVVSGGCDKVVRVWDVKSGHCIYTLSGHTSTIRCMRVLHGRPIAVTGSRDGTVRVWNVQRGRAVRCLRGHEGSVRCLDVNGRRVVSGSYDATCRMWDIDTGECIHVLRGHYSQIYSVVFDGIRVASGGLDTTVRVWDAETGHCTALLQGHTALVCQLQLSPTHSILATGGSDGRVITFSLSSFQALHRIAAHDSSVTALQFDGRFLVTGGNDGRVRLFETGSGRYVRELSEEGECVWKVGYAGGTCAVMGKRAGKTVMEIWSFRPREGE